MNSLASLQFWAVAIHVVFICISTILLIPVYFQSKKTIRHEFWGKSYVVSMLISLIPIFGIQVYLAHSNLLGGEFFHAKIGVISSLIIFNELALGVQSVRKFYFKNVQIIVSLLILNFMIIFLSSFYNRNLTEGYYTYSSLLVVYFLMSFLPLMMKVRLRFFHSFYMLSTVSFSFFLLINSNLIRRLFGEAVSRALIYNPFIIILFIVIKLYFLRGAIQKCKRSGVLEDFSQIYT